MVFIMIFFISWLCFYFSPKKQVMMFYPTMMLASILGLFTDLLTIYYPLWKYTNNLHEGIILILDDFGVYPVVVYLYLQRVPKPLLQWVKYTFLWSFVAFALELMLFTTHHMEYHFWWNIEYSYIFDWVLYLIFTLHHRMIEKHLTLK